MAALASVLTVKRAAIGGAAIGPALGALPYWVYFALDVASHGPEHGVSNLLRAIVVSMFYVPIILPAAYLTAAIPAAIAGAGYIYMLGRWPQTGRPKLLRISCAAAIAGGTCALWVFTVGQLSVVEYIGTMKWLVIGCGAFAGAFLAFFYPREVVHDAAA